MRMIQQWRELQLLLVCASAIQFQIPFKSNTQWYVTALGITRPNTITTVSLNTSTNSRAPSNSRSLSSSFEWIERYSRRELLIVRGGESPEGKPDDESATNAPHGQFSNHTNYSSMGKITEPRRETKQERGITWALYMSYLTLMGAKVALPSTLSLLTSSTTHSGLSFPIPSSTHTSAAFVGLTKSQYMAKILKASTLGIALGKLLTGPIIDRLGGILCLRIALSTLAILLMKIASTTNIVTFRSCWIWVDFIFASCWAACLHAIQSSFVLQATTCNSTQLSTEAKDENNQNSSWIVESEQYQQQQQQIWGGKIRGLALSSRLGNAIFFTFFASILSWTKQFGKSFSSPLSFHNLYQDLGNMNHVFHNLQQICTWILQKLMQSPDQYWRMVFWISGWIQIVPLILLAKYGTFHENKKVTIGVRSSTNGTSSKDATINNTNTMNVDNTNNVSVNDANAQKKLQAYPQPKKNPFILLWKEAQTVPFWCHLINRSAMIIIASFLLFVPSYMTTCFQMTTSSAARVGSVYAIGCLLALSPGPKRWLGALTSEDTGSGRAKTLKKIVTVNVLLGTLLGCCLLQMGHISGILPISKGVALASMFLWGFSFAIPFYIPSSLYALRRGGKTSSATIADTFDFFGFLLLAWFNGYVASLPLHMTSSWLGPYKVMLVCTISSIVSLSTAFYLESNESKS